MIRTELVTEPGDLPPGQSSVPVLRVKHYGPIPRADPAAWQMDFRGETLDGLAHRLSFAEMVSMPSTIVIADHHCATGWTKRANVWQGVPARDVVARFPPAAGAVSLLAYGEYGYAATLRIEDLLRPETLLATHLGPGRLTPAHGYPVRLVVPHLYGFKGPKWFRGWEYTREITRGFWEQRGYHVTGDARLGQRYSYME